ncbi:MAG: TolC family protein [Methylacidiphilales bacterium]|nr:TolC family protein [Candidatus Methylacidiphilales bacterium]
MKQTLSVFLMSSLLLCNIHAENFIEIIDSATLNDPSFKISNLQTNLESAKIDTSWSFSHPSINITGTRKQSTNLSNSIGGFSQNTKESNIQNSYELTIKQPIYNQAIVAFSEESEYLRKTIEHKKTTQYQEFLLRISKLYFDTAYSQDVYESALSQKQSLQTQLALAEKQFEVGAVSNTVLQQIKAAYDNAEVGLLTAGQQLQQQYDSLESVTGKKFAKLKSISPSIPLEIPPPISQQEWIDLALAQNPNLLSAINYQVSTAYAVRRTEAEYVPALDLSVRYGVNTTKFNEYTSPFASFVNPNKKNTNYSVDLTLTIPLYNAPLLGQIQESVLQREIASEQARSTTIQIELQTKNIYQGLISTIRQVKALEQSYKSFKVAEEAIRAGFSVGIQSTSDLVQAIANSENAKRDLALVRYTYIYNLLSLHAIAGKLNYQTLRNYSIYFN